MIHTVKGFGVVNKAEVDVFLELSWFFDEPPDVGNLTSGSSAFSIQLEHLEVLGSCTVEAWLGEYIYIYIIMTDSCCGMAETNTTL